MTGSVIFRALRPEDAPARQALRLEALRDFPANFGSSYEIEKDYPLERFAQVPDPAEGLILGAFDAGALVGMGGLFANASPKRCLWGGIGYMYVRPPYWGSGVSSNILKCLIEFSNPIYEYLELSVTAGNERAQRLYVRHGFTEFARRPDSVVQDGKRYDEVLMMRRRSPG